MLCLATSSLEGSLLRAEAAFVFLLDAPRNELWLLTDEPATLR